MKMTHLESDTGQNIAGLDNRTRSLIDDLKNTDKVERKMDENHYVTDARLQKLEEAIIEGKSQDYKLKIN
ncbi:hypothetical protein KUTeg_017495 [Tegillarca granosa]|uniref:Uncharacterized protein n=1 Tax=Tegillarca granosa TaxID=220873 RepID=A0ABQ9EK03_TEGGR|nr:hypothetical protein KUTeg_017495 [Tegillarca granosa]